MRYKEVSVNKQRIDKTEIIDDIEKLLVFGYIYWRYFKTQNGSYFYRATACNATHGIAVAILSVCPSVRPSDACIVRKLNNALRIF